MAFWHSGVFRIIFSNLLGFLLGALYYNPALNPLAKDWVALTYPGVSDPRQVNDPMLPMIGAVVCTFLITIFVNRYVNFRQLTTPRLVLMAIELWILTVLFQLPKTLFGNQSLELFAINHFYDLLEALTITLVLGYKRFPVADGEKVKT